MKGHGTVLTGKHIANNASQVGGQPPQIGMEDEENGDDRSRI